MGIQILGPLLLAIPSLYNMKWSLCLLCSGEELKLSIDLQAKVPVHQPWLWFTWVQDAARGRTVSSLRDSELPLCYLQMIWFCSLHQIVNCMCSGWIAAGMTVSTFKLWGLLSVIRSALGKHDRESPLLSIKYDVFWHRFLQNFHTLKSHCKAD